MSQLLHFSVFVATHDANEFIGYTLPSSEERVAKLVQGLLDAGAPAWVSAAAVSPEPDGFYFFAPSAGP